MKKYLLGLLLILSNMVYSQSTCDSLLVYDDIEFYTWLGLWNSTANTGYYTNAFVSPNASAAIIGLGLGSSPIEQNTYVLPNIAVNPNFQHIFRFRLGSYRITSTGSASGTDGSDYVDVRLSTNSGITYTSEMRITGFSNAYWDYNTNAIASKTANGTLQTFSPAAGGNRTNTGDGYSIIELTIPAGFSDIAINLFCRVNASGEEWWIDNMELIQVIQRPQNPILITPFSVDTTICFGSFIDLNANSNIGALEWFEQSSGGAAIATGNSFSTSMLTQNTSYWVQSNNAGCLSDRTQTNILIDGCFLPLELLNFYGMQRLNSIDLFWETANEINTDFFVIEKSYDGIEWNQIGIVEAVGEPFYDISYSFTDKIPKGGYNYYRLKQYDIDGKYEIFHMISVEYKKTEIVTHYSNNVLSLREVEEFTKYKLINSNGIVISQNDIISNSQDFQIDYIPSGIYILLLMKSDNSFETVKIYIKN